MHVIENYKETINASVGRVKIYTIISVFNGQLKTGGDLCMLQVS